MQVLAYDKIGDDIEETAALIQALDCVVTVDNTIAHLVGALGKRGMLMLEHHADWRWLTDRSTSPWYPSLTSVVRISPAIGKPCWTRLPVCCISLSMHVMHSILQ